LFGKLRENERENEEKIIFHFMELINTITISVAPTLLIEYVSDTGICYYI